MTKVKEKDSKKEKPRKKKTEKVKKEKSPKKPAEIKIDPIRSSREIKPKPKSLVTQAAAKGKEEDLSSSHRGKKYATSNGVEKEPGAKPERYFEAVGRRKTSIARVRLFTRRGARVLSVAETPDLGEKEFLVNGKPYNVYFPALELKQIAQSSLEKMNCLDKFMVQVLVKGGGFHSQAEAVRHGTARALILFNPDFRKRLKKAGFLTRDPRMRERKKFGLKRARKAPQWAKR